MQEHKLTHPRDDVSSDSHPDKMRPSIANPINGFAVSLVDIQATLGMTDLHIPVKRWSPIQIHDTRALCLQARGKIRNANV
jgi:hypothetical protein